MDRLLRTPQADRAEEDHSANRIVLPANAVVGVTAAEHSQNPLIRADLVREKFENFRVEHGDLIWDDYGLCFPIADLYENRI